VNGPGQADVRPFLLDGARGPLYAVYFPPVGARSAAGDILVAPAFAEEMNRCRAMVALQARRFASLGIGTLVVDPTGTGDSAGEFGEGTWRLWREDLLRGLDWLRSHGSGCRTAWGIRLGAIMAAELATAGVGIDRLLLWQPVTHGKSFLTQFLRIRVAAELEQSVGVKSTDELRRRSSAGEAVEVSGYPLNPELVRELDELQLPAAAPLGGVRLGWLDVAPSAEVPSNPVHQKLLAAYAAGGVHASFGRVVGPSFWQLHERAEVPELIDATARLVTAWPEPAGLPAAAAAAPTASLDGAAGAVERPLAFGCEDDALVGVLHRGRSAARRGIVIIVAGGPQYRAGAHRQFVSLARRLAAGGYPVLRFDLRGMGDSSGQHRGFQDSAVDVRAAIDALLDAEPTVQEVVLFGECESASGILFYAYRDRRVAGIALVNPWVRTEEGRAGVMIKHYYLDRLRSPEFWAKVRSGAFNPVQALGSFLAQLRLYRRGRRAQRLAATAGTGDDITTLPLPLKTAAGLRRFGGHVFILMSGRDFIAREFDEVVRSSPAWRGLLENPRVLRRELADADHTFSRREWKTQAADWLGEWLGSW
jgi:exosortase A-associated hydrolase 1/exosortase A-associated hydrolase 2